MSREYRHELKFLCSEEELLLIESRIKNVCKIDKNAGKTGVYNIRSVYFDSYDNEFYYENEMGVDNRYKYRIRIYNYSDEIIKLERKSTIRGMKQKTDCTITREQCIQLLQNRKIIDYREDQQLLQEFCAERQYKLLKPKVVVEYVRTPYVYPVGNVRITFDRYISASNNMNLFDKEAPKRGIMPSGLHVLEVKYDDILPHTLLELINSNHRLQRTSFSKYALCRKYDMK